MTESIVSRISASDTTIPVTVQCRCRATPARAFDVIVPIDLTTLFASQWPIPGVVRVRDQTGAWDRVGRSRTPVLSDGSTVRELLTEYTRPHSFAYELTRFSGSMRHLVSAIRGEWTFTPDGEHTVVRWTYELVPRRRRAWAVRALLAPVWARYARSTLERACEIADL